MDDLRTRLLEYYGITEEDYADLTKEVSEENFLEGHSFEGIGRASDFLKESLKNGKKVFVYGDYDADGIMGTSILVKMLSYAGYPAGYYIPSRYLDGYGITLEKAKEIVSKGYDIVITVDNGISAFPAIEYLKEQGLSVLVLDHHTPMEKLPPADYIVHPLLSKLGEYSSSGAFMAFCFSLEFLGRFDGYLSVLAGISLVSDMMPLRGYNRNLLRLVIRNYENHGYLPIDLLKGEEPFNETSIGMKIAPKINSIGRIIETDEINHIVSFFTSDDESVILNYRDWIETTNEKRKEITKEASESMTYESGGKLVFSITELKEGLLGLAANSIASKTRLPSFVLTKDQSGESYKCSARCPEGFNIVDAFRDSSDLLLTYGGHALAGGCSVAGKDLEAFRLRLEAYCESHPFHKPARTAINMVVSEISMDSYRLVNSFSPFGESWKSPLFILKRMKVPSLMYSKTKEHIITQIGSRSRIVGFGFSQEKMKDLDYVDMLGNLSVNSFRGIDTAVFMIREIKRSDR